MSEAKREIKQRKAEIWSILYNAFEEEREPGVDNTVEYARKIADKLMGHVCAIEQLEQNEADADFDVILHVAQQAYRAPLYHKRNAARTIAKFLEPFLTPEQPSPPTVAQGETP